MKTVATVTSKVKDFLPTRKIDLEKEDIYSEAPMEGGSNVAKLLEDLVDSKRLIEALNINPELLAVKQDRIQEVIIKNHRAFGLDDLLGCHSYSFETRSKGNFSSTFPHFSCQLRSY